MVDIEQVRLLTRQGTNFNALSEDMFRTSLHRATMEGHRDIVNVLLAEGVPIDVRSCGGVTTLHYAIEKGHEDVVNLLVVKVTLSGTGKHPYFQVTL